MKTTYDSKTFKSHNKSGKPDNIVEKENDIYLECEAIQKELPNFWRPYFAYLKGNVLPMTRLAYLHDVSDETGGRCETGVYHHGEFGGPAAVGVVRLNGIVDAREVPYAKLVHALEERIHPNGILRYERGADV